MGKRRGRAQGRQLTQGRGRGSLPLVRDDAVLLVWGLAAVDVRHNPETRSLIQQYGVYTTFYLHATHLDCELPKGASPPVQLTSQSSPLNLGTMMNRSAIYES